MNLSEEIVPELSDEPAVAIQERYRRGYSWAALVFGYFYFRSMRDQLFAWLSLIAALSLVLSPVLLLLPFWARRRAWAQRDWLDYNEFATVQKKWDVAALIGLAVLLFVAYFSYQASSGLMNALLKNLDPLRQSGQPIDPSQELERIQQNIKGGLGQ